MSDLNHQGDDDFNLDGIVTAEDLLASLRKGNGQKLELGIGSIKVPCRLLNANEEATIVVKAKQKAMKENPTGLKQEVFESNETMRAILSAATTINGAPSLPLGFVESLTADELSMLFDDYMAIKKTINPNMRELTPEQVKDIVERIKKKDATSKDFFIYQQAEIGRYFMDVIIPSLPTDNGPGSLS